MKKYESVIIINPKLEEKEIKDTIEKYKNMMNEFSNKKVTVEDLGERKLAYEIRKNNTGYYAVFNFYSEPNNISELERNYRIDDNVIKFIIIRQDELEYDESEEEDEEEY
ncbi:MAG: 30S ribosomal protein S6 [Clostridia bacterium]|nr:30S ribosomal protein S6 [Clostridia bacterium]